MFLLSVKLRLTVLFSHLWTQELVQKIKESGGRFLKRGSDEFWYEINDDEARDKARAALSEHKWGVNKETTKAAEPQKPSPISAKRSAVLAERKRGRSEQPVPAAASVSTTSDQQLFHCSKCLRSFTVGSQTAKASWVNHVRRCDPEGKTAKRVEGPPPKDEHGEAVTDGHAERKGVSTDQVGKSPLKRTRIDPQNAARRDDADVMKPASAAADPHYVSFHCAKCLRSFSFAPQTAGACWKNHVRRCDPEGLNAKKVEGLAPPKREQVDGSQADQKMSSPKVEECIDHQSPVITAPESTARSPRRLPLERSPAKCSTPTTPRHIHSQPNDGDIILSLNNPRYKRVMFEQFRTLGLRGAGDTPGQLDVKKNEVLAMFKQEMSGDAKFFKSDRHGTKTFEVGDTAALESKSLCVTSHGS